MINSTNNQCIHAFATLPQSTQRNIIKMLWLLILSIIIEGINFALLIPIFRSALAHNLSDFIHYASIFISITLLQLSILYYALRAGYLSGVSLTLGLIQRLLHHLPFVKLDQSLYQLQPQNLVRHSVLEAMSIPAHLLEPLLRIILTPIVFSITIIIYSPILGLSLLTIFSLLAILMKYFTRSNQALDIEKHKHDSIVANELQLFANQQPLLRASQLTQQSDQRLHHALAQQNQSLLSLMRHKFWLDIGYISILQLMLLAILITTMMFAYHQSLDHGLLLALLIVLFHFIEPYSQLLQFNQSLQNSWLSLMKVIQVLDLPLIRAKPSVELPNHYNIRLDNICYQTDEHRIIIQNFSHAFEANTTTAIIGASGVGKSTLLKIIAGIIQPNQGHVLIDHINIENFDHIQLSQLRSLFSQDVSLFKESIAWNIQMGNINATEQDMNKVIKSVGLEADLNNMPQGKNTNIGPNGLQLSGGQRARVALARTLFNPAPILLLDEPTANLDSERSQLIIEALKEMHGQRTIIIVTHDPQLMKIADHQIKLT